MFQQFVMLILSAKSLLGLTAAYEIASAGRVTEAITLGSFSVAPPVWGALKKALAWPACEDFNWPDPV